MENNIEDSQKNNNSSEDQPARSIKMEKIENAANDAKKSESAYSKSCSNTPSKRSYNSKSMHSGSNSSGSSGYGGKQSTSAYCYKDDTMKKSEKTENNTKVSDSAYSNTYSNSQSRSYSSKSMHSGSNSSGSSGYGGKLSTSDYNQLPEKRNKDKEGKKKKQTPTESEVIPDKKETESSPTELEPIPETPKEYPNNEPQGSSTNFVLPPPPVLEVEEEKPEVVEISTRKCSTTDEFASPTSVVTALNANYSIADYTGCPFTCVVSMQDGIVMYATTSMTSALGYTKDMWMDRSFIEFVHPRDYKTFTSQIASGVAVPSNANAAPPGNDMSSMVCRIRQYKGLTTAAFQIRRKIISYIPYFLKFFFKNIDDEEGLVTYLVIQASPLSPAFKTSNELILSLKPFIMRHSASGIIQYLDPKSVPYLGYLPQDVEDKNALQLYHPSDLGYILQVYETIIRDGGKLRSKPYRMLAQNGFYLRLETEWSTYINPWSRKVEFVTCKHFILQGPRNPDVFQSFNNKNNEKMPEDEEMKAQVLIKNIIRVMNEVTKPANQQMSKKCHELAIYMETLMDEIPKNNTNLTIEVTDVDQSFNEPDSVMLGGMSPHHDLSDSKTSSETPVSYNQLNYNETLQRYFDNHDDSEENNTTDVIDKPDSGDTSSKPVAPEEKGVEKFVDKLYLDAKLLAVTNYNHVLSGYQNSWLTESMLKKHNLEMEKELVKTHRENRCMNKSEREKLLNELRQKKIDHLARCNNVFVHQGIENMEFQHYGLKRASIQIDEASAQKQRCSSERLMQQAQTETAVDILSTSAVPITMGQPCQFPSMDIADYINHEIQNKMDAISSQSLNQLNQVPYQSQIPAMMFGRPVYGSPFMYSPMDPNVQYTLQQSFMSQIIPSTQALAIPSKNYEQACKMTFLPKTGKSFGNLARKRAKAVEKKKNEACDTSNTSIEASIPSKESSTENPNKRKLTPKNSLPSNPAEEESSYSSFYSSFFKTDSGSNEEIDAKNVLKLWQQQSQGADGITLPNPEPVIATKTMAPKRKVQPPWLEHVHVTSELIYKYQIVTKDLDEVLKDDREKLKTLEQPELVNEQLGQLYMELEKEGLPVKLNIEEGITSSSSSGEDILIMDATKLRRRKREYSQLVMIYEEDAPLPPPDDEDELNCKTT